MDKRGLAKKIDLELRFCFRVAQGYTGIFSSLVFLPHCTRKGLTKKSEFKNVPYSTNLELGCEVNYLVTQENLNILRKFNKTAKDANIHCALLPMYWKGIIYRIKSRPNQSNVLIHSVKYDCLSLQEQRSLTTWLNHPVARCVSHFSIKILK